MADNAFDFEKVIAELEELIARLKSPESRAEAQEQGIDAEAEVARLEGELRRVMIQHYSNLSPWEKVQVARYKDRPYALDYIRSICDEFMELSGDRMAGNDEAVVGGLARLAGEPVVIIAQQKARDIKERQRRNFGMAHAEGFRKALRLAKMAEKFRKPLLSFVDTAGAAADLKAEEHGVSEAIARNLREIALLETPVVSVIIGEGGSGGALGMAVADRVLMLEHAVYSVISPEGCASILWRDKAKAPDAAAALQITAQSAKRFGLVDEVVPEPLGGAHRNPLEMAETLKAALLKNLGALKCQMPRELVNARYARLRCLGVWEEKQA
jgi:acetyl-CoA carboxylase carboxyl transferase subunit alpha